MGVDLKKMLWSPSAGPVKGLDQLEHHDRVDKCPWGWVQGTSDCEIRTE